MNNVTEIFSDENVRVFFRDGLADYLLVTLNEIGLSGGRTFWGASLAERLDLSCVGIVSRHQDWFPHFSGSAALKFIQDIALRFPVRIIFGTSMGAFGAIKYGKLFHATHVLAYCPQFSIDPAIVGSFDSRFAAFFKPDLHEGLKIEQSDFGCPTYIICDPLKTEDAAHAKLIEKASAGSWVSRVHAPYAGHEVSLALKGSASFQVITRLMMENDRNALQRYVRERSKSYSRAPIMIAVTFERRGNYTLAASWIEKARAQSRNDHIVLFFASRIQFRLGHFDLANQFIDEALLLKPDVPYFRTLAEQISARRKLAAGDVIKRKVIEASGSLAVRLNVKMVGNIGNLMLQYMTAVTLRHAGLVSDIYGLTIPEWGIAFEKPKSPSEFEFAGKFTKSEFMQRSKGLETVGYSSLGLRFESFLGADFYKGLFDGSHIVADGYAADSIVFNVRLGDTANGLHPDYTLIPISFYQHLVERTGLRPVFLGQLSDDIYSQALFETFPNAEFAPSRGPMADFETLRRSAVICCAVSTFSFLAAWLSSAQKVYFPLTGAFNPMQRLDNDMIPTKDSRYEFYTFPINYSEPMDVVVPTLERRAGSWCYVSRNMATKLLNHESHFSVPIETAAEFFDEEYYLRKYPDIARHVRAGRLSSGLEHFRASGHFEHRQPFELDARWYANKYPDASIAVGLGRLRSLHDYHMEVGHALGHSPSNRDAFQV